MKQLNRNVKTKETTIVEVPAPGDTKDQIADYFSYDELMLLGLDKKRQIDEALYSGEGDLSALQAEYKKIKSDMEKIKVKYK